MLPAHVTAMHYLSKKDLEEITKGLVEGSSEMALPSPEVRPPVGVDDSADESEDAPAPAGEAVEDAPPPIPAPSGA